MYALDARLFAWIVAHRQPPLDAAMLALSTTGRGGLVWLVFGAALALARRIPLSALVSLTLAILLATLAADHVLKPLIHRQRPFVRAASLVIGKKPDDWSFPSGHSANAFAGATVLARAAPAAAPLWWALAALIALSRVYLGVHYPLDVVGGAILGWLCGVLASEAFREPRLSGSRRTRDS